MKTQRKRVLLLFAGGAPLLDSDGNVRTVEKAQDLRPWLQQVPELSILADVEPVFLLSGNAFDVQPQWWQRIALAIQEHIATVDGVIVTQPVDVIPYTAAALTLMVRQCGKPIIITGASELSAPATHRAGKDVRGSDVGIRANLVNAMQVATLDLGEIVVLFGNRLLRAGTVVRQAEPSPNLFESIGVEPLGRVDFGLKLANHRQHRKVGKSLFATAVESGVVQLTLIPTALEHNLSSLDVPDISGILVSGQSQGVPQGLLAKIRARAEARKLPLAYAVPWRAVRVPVGYLPIPRVTQVMALVKFMWALGQTKSGKRLQTLLKTNIAGEQIAGGHHP